MSTNYYSFTALTGGVAGCLDYFDGNTLNNKDQAFGTVLAINTFGVYALNATSGATADGVNIIIPATNPGAKRWILQNLYGSSGTFTLTGYGFSGTAPTTTGRYTLLNNSVVLGIDAFSGTSNSSQFWVTGLPTALIPARNQIMALPAGTLIDNGVGVPVAKYLDYYAAILNPGGEIYFTIYNGFTTSGQKALGDNITLIYNLL